jgi:hypothetical protein
MWKFENGDWKNFRDPALDSEPSKKKQPRKRTPKKK